MSDGLAKSAIILASSSETRRRLLRGAGIAYECAAADLDEGAMLQECESHGFSANEAAQTLAAAKAKKIAALNPDALVIGCDQILHCQDLWFSKPKDRASAEKDLRFLRGKQHFLASAVVVAKQDTVLWRHTETAAMHMRDFSDAFLQDYMEKMGDAVLLSVGCYQLEGIGAQLFDKIAGDYFSILGLPLVPLLGALRSLDAIGK